MKPLWSRTGTRHHGTVDSPAAPARTAMKGCLPGGFAVSAAVLCLTLGTPLQANGSGLAPPWIGHVFSGPATADAAATYWNPAMLAGVRTPRLESNLELVVPYISYTRERLGVYQREDGLKFSLPLEENDLDRRKTGVTQSVGPSNVVIPAGSIFGAIPLHERVTLGLGVFGLAGAIIKFPDTGPARWQLQEASVLGMAVTAGVGVKVNDWFKVGATVYYVGGRMGLRKVADLAGTDLLGKALSNPPINQPNAFGQSAPTAVRELSVLSRPFTLKDATANVATFALGVAFEPSKDFTLGLSYLHRVPLKLKGEFYLDMNDDFFTKDLSSQGLKYPAMVHGDAYVEFPLPFSMKLGAAWQVHPRLRLQGLFEYFHNSDINEFLITLKSPDLAQPTLKVSDVVKLREPRRWNNTISTLLTGIFKATANIDLGLGLGYQSSASPDETLDLASPDGDRLVLQLAGRLTFGRWDLTAALHVHHFLERHVTTSDFDKANGTYSMNFVLFTGSIGLSF